MKSATWCGVTSLNSFLPIFYEREDSTDVNLLVIDSLVSGIVSYLPLSRDGDMYPC